MKNSFLLVSLFIMTSFLPLFSQYYVTGQDPASMKWEQIESQHFKIIFPQSFAGMANSYANLLEKSYLNASTIYPGINGKLPVIIHNYSMISNGYVSWAPKRIELYPLAGQVNQPDDPSQLLIMHEVTHVAQLSSLNTGFTRFMSFLLGQQAVGLASAMLPLWALEGDAVYAETRFSNSGRGRSLSFTQEEKSIVMDPDGKYDYNKMLFGSYRDFTPDRYVYGFAMMSYLRSTYPGFWENNVSYTGRNSFMVLPTNINLKRKLNINKNALYNNTLDSLKNAWDKTDKEYTYQNYKSLVPGKRTGYANYLNPYITTDGKIVALKTSLSDPKHFVLIDTLNHTERNILTTGLVYPSFFSYSNGKVVWAETQPDPRWDNRSYSVIKIMDILSGHPTRLTSHTRYSAPSLSHDASLIVAVNNLLDLSTSLVIIDPVTGLIKEEIDAPGNVFLQRPEWSSDDSSIVTVTLSSAGEGVARYDLSGKSWEFLIKPSHNDIEKAELVNDNLYILMQDNYSNNIYCRKKDGLYKQISFSKFGISSFSVSAEKVIFSDYSNDGFNVSEISIDTLYNTNNILSSNTLFANKSDTSTAFVIDTVKYNIKHYKRIGHILNLHSWAPLYYDIDDIMSGTTTVNPGFTILSQNNLSTFISTFGFEHNRYGNFLHSSLTWQGIYPVISVKATYGGSDLFNISSKNKNGFSINSRISVPLSWSQNKFSQLFIPSIEITDLDNYDFFVYPRLYFYNLFRMAERDIYPKWGQVIDVQVKSAPWDDHRFQSLKGFAGILFFPGLIKNHSTMLRLGYETQSPIKQSIFTNINTFPRGYEGLASAELSKASFDYTFPLFYPDLSAGLFLYLKRIRGNVFYDWASSNGTYYPEISKYYDDHRTFSSAGGELLGDFYLFRIPYEITSGVRCGYTLNERVFFSEMVFSINVYGSTLGKKR